VLDEVVSALDVSVQAQILNLIKRLQQEQGFGAIFISHDLAVVRYVAHRVAVLYAGTLVELAPAIALYEGSAHPYSRTLQLAHSATPDERFELRDAGGPIPEPGCVLAPRCPFAIERCRTDTPRLRRVGDSQVACHRAEEVAAIPTAEPSGSAVAQ
jgi:oligopeptide/dipeptide ABC transporter ATP-binding protein